MRHPDPQVMGWLRGEPLPCGPDPDEPGLPVELLRQRVHDRLRCIENGPGVSADRWRRIEEAPA